MILFNLLPVMIYKSTNSFMATLFVLLASSLATFPTTNTGPAGKRKLQLSTVPPYSPVPHVHVLNTFS